MQKKAALDAISTIRYGLDALEEAIKAPTSKKTVKKKTTTIKKKKKQIGSVDATYRGGDCDRGPASRC
jgi:hypothetical protein